MKKINQYILTNYPLIWNTRFHIIFPIVILLNMLFYLFGYLTAIDIPSLSDFRMNRDTGLNIMAVLFAVILVLCWLVYYLRHNALKGMLPLRKYHLAKEFLLIFLIMFGTCMFITSHEKGEIDKVRRLSKSIDLNKEAEIEMLAEHFLPYNESAFRKQRENDVTYIADSAEVYRRLNYLYYNAWRNQAYYFGNDSTAIRDSLLHEQALNWLTNHKEDSIKQAINQYLALCKKYGGEYRLNVDAHVASIFAKPGFWIDREMIYQSKPDSGKSEYITTSNVNYAFSTIMEARNGLDKNVWYLIYYFAISFAIVIFSFRITHVRTWFIGLVTLLVLSIICGLLAAASVNGAGVLWFIFFLALICFGIGILGILNKTSKQVAGVSFVLSIWVLPFFILLIYAVLMQSSEPSYDYYRYVNDTNRELNVCKHYPFYCWLKDHFTEWNYANIIFAFLMIIFVVAPLAKRWQANPVE